MPASVARPRVGGREHSYSHWTDAAFAVSVVVSHRASHQ